MLQDALLLLAVGLLGSLLVAAVRLAVGASAERVVTQLRVTLLAGLLPFMMSGAVLSLLPALLSGELLGLRGVGGQLEVPQSVFMLRLGALVVAGGASGLLLFALRLLRRPQALQSAAADLRQFGLALAADYRALLGSGRVPWLAVPVLLVVVLGVLARGHLLALPMSYDEAITYVFFSSRSPLDIISDYSIPNNHILHSLVMHGTAVLFGGGELPVRIMALVAGIALIPATAWLGWKEFGYSAGLCAAAIVAAAPAVVEYSAQARGYTLAAVLFVVLLLALLYALETATRTGWTLYAGCLALSLFTITSTWMTVYFVAGWLLLRRSDRKQLVRFVVATGSGVAAAVLCYLPAALRVGWRSIVANDYVRPHTRVELLHLARQALRGLQACWGGGLPSWLLGIGIALLLLGMGARWRGRRGGAHLVGGVVLMLVLVVVLHRTVPPVRTLLPVFPVFAVVVGAGWSAAAGVLHRHACWVTAMIAVVGAAAWSLAVEKRASNAVAATVSGTFSNSGTEARHCCAEGFFPDAERVAKYGKEATSDARPIVVNFHSGLAETVRFYLIQEQVPITRVHPFVPKVGLEQLDGYQEVIVLSRVDGPPADPYAEAASELQIPRAELERGYRAALQPLTLSSSVLIRLSPRTGASLARSGSRRVNLLDYPR